MNTSSHRHPKKQAGAARWLRDQACCCRFWCSVHHHDSRLAVAAGDAVAVAAGKGEGGVGVAAVREYHGK
ncbi:MAG: hypothetical protein KAS74_03905 [Methanosarcinales archaeon]|nr:hypothetical protein [Methanosarcinales archaeon]